MHIRYQGQISNNYTKIIKYQNIQLVILIASSDIPALVLFLFAAICFIAVFKEFLDNWSLFFHLSRLLLSLYIFLLLIYLLGVLTSLSLYGFIFDLIYWIFLYSLSKTYILGLSSRPYFALLPLKWTLKSILLNAYASLFLKLNLRLLC